MYPGTMEKIQAPRQLRTSGNLSANWRTFKQIFQLHVEALDLNGASDARKIALLLTTAGGHALEIFNSFHFAEDQHKTKFQTILDKFGSHCEVDTNEIFERYIFKQRLQVSKNMHKILVIDALVMLICLTSVVLCTRSIVLGWNLHQRFITFFLKKHKAVCLSDHLEFLNGWYILIIISDLMTIVGSIIKMEITSKNLTTYDVCSISLGTSTLFAWVGVLRYLGCFQKYNVLILTMRGAFPKVLRFCCCAGMIYLGYMFCGWIVLGPYHSKFEKLSAVAECLFSLINGDDMFATFAEIQEKSNLLWLFSRIYLYSFISLFIYMILSLFIALITDTYETIKKCQRNGFPQTDLHNFMTACSVTPHLSRHGSTDDDDKLLL